MPKMFSPSTMFLKKFSAHENMKNPASKVAKPAQIQPKPQFLFHKNLPPQDFSKWLWVWLWERHSLWAAQSGPLMVWCNLIVEDCQNKSLETYPFHEAAAKGHFKIFILISTYVQNCKSMYCYLKTPLHLSVKSCQWIYAHNKFPPISFYFFFGHLILQTQ